MSRLSIILVLAAAVCGCGGGTPTAPEQSSGTAGALGAASPDASETATVELRYDETIAFRDLEMRWLDLQDSRCPIGVTCVWAGQMIATVEVVHITQGTTQVELLRRAGREPEVSYAFDYDLRLLDVSPHPKENVTPDRGDYVMHIEVFKL
jgi:hypothetical protein